MFPANSYDITGWKTRNMTIFWTLIRLAVWKSNFVAEQRVTANHLIIHRLVLSPYTLCHLLVIIIFTWFSTFFFKFFLNSFRGSAAWGVKVGRMFVNDAELISGRNKRFLRLNYSAHLINEFSKFSCSKLCYSINGFR